MENLLAPIWETVAANLETYIVILSAGIYEDCLRYLINKRVDQAGDVEVSVFFAR